MNPLIPAIIIILIIIIFLVIVSINSYEIKIFNNNNKFKDTQIVINKNPNANSSEVSTSSFLPPIISNVSISTNDVLPPSNNKITAIFKIEGSNFEPTSVSVIETKYSFLVYDAKTDSFTFNLNCNYPQEFKNYLNVVTEYGISNDYLLSFYKPTISYYTYSNGVFVLTGTNFYSPCYVYLDDLVGYPEYTITPNKITITNSTSLTFNYKLDANWIGNELTLYTIFGKASVEMFY